MALSQSSEPIITEAALCAILEQSRSQIEANPGPAVLNVVLAPGRERFHVTLDPRLNLPELVDASIARANAEAGLSSSSSEIQFAEEIKRLWTAYDHEEMVLCLLTVGQATQITVRPKPWAEDLHEHCTCGFRRGADAAHDAAHVEANIIGDAAGALGALLEEHGVPDGHGLDHARRVLAHTRAALECAPRPPSPEVRLAMILAALLHDADDHKYFGEGAGAGAPTSNAGQILGAALAGHPEGDEVRALALEAIGLVSASGNGNETPPRAGELPFLLYPRWADRLEAIGERGVVRCWEYSLEVDRPLFLADSPAPATAAEVFALATPDRFAAYQGRKESASMIDHYFDKLLHLIGPLVRSDNEYFATNARARIQPLVEVCTAGRPEALEARLQVAKARAEAGAA